METRTTSRFRLHTVQNPFVQVKLLWAIIRMVLFVWTGFQFVDMPLHAQERPLFPVVLGNNIVGRVVAANSDNGTASSEPMHGVVVRVAEMDLTAKLDGKGFFTITNVMNGKYTLQILSEGTSAILASQSILLRGHDVNVPPIAVERGDYVLCGRVTLADDRSAGVANVRITLGNGFCTTTDARGYYAFDNLRHNMSYTLKADNLGISTKIGANTSTGNVYVIHSADRSVKMSGAITRRNFLVERANLEEIMASASNDAALGVEGGPLRVNTPTKPMVK